MMKSRVVICSVALLVVSLFVEVAMADSRSEELLAELTQKIESLERYECNFSVDMNGEMVVKKASYMVDGERFKLSIADQVIYGDGKQRFTVSGSAKEVVKERVNEMSPMLITDPARAFLSLSASFDAKMLEDGVVELTPKDDDSLLERSLLELDAKSHLPKRVSYFSNGDHISIGINSFVASEGVIPPLDEIDMSGYEIIDIR